MSFVVLIHIVTLFLSAVLLFAIQPMLGKMLLPKFGGTPTTWNACMVFFQSTLLCGYLYAHLSTRWLGLRRQAILHVSLLLAPLLFLPVVLDWHDSALIAQWPAFALVQALFVTAGVPFLAVSTTAPLLQKWFADSGHASSGDPYFLYTASNAGSLLALLAYPLLFEPQLTLMEQSDYWRIGYLVLVAMICVCAVLLYRSRSVMGRSDASADEPIPTAVNLRRRLRWTLYAFIPSSLMLGVTSYITTDVASLPLLWVIPLALYLLTFIFAFAKQQWLDTGWMGRVLALIAIPGIVALITESNDPSFLLIPEHLLLFFVASMLCHGLLAQDRPTPEHLTEFYLWVSVGGVLGGAFNTFVAPLLFDRILEYPVMIVLACFLRPPADRRTSTRRERNLDVLLPVATALLTAGLWLTTKWSGLENVVLIFAIPALLTLSFSRRPMRYALGLVALLLGSAGYVGPFGRTIDTERNFFGVIRVTDDTARAERLIVHGNTVHGSEGLDASRRGYPTTYYHRDGPVGDIFAAFAGADSKRAVGVIGLGVGALASYAKPHESWDFYEINPAVIRIAQTPAYFSFLRNSRSQRLNVVAGDARLSLANVTDGEYGLLALDAFSSDAIPVHLVTREAVELYLRKLAPDGLLAFHITNRHFNLEPALGRVATELRLVGRTRVDVPELTDEQPSARDSSTWIVMSRSGKALEALNANPQWRPIQLAADAPLWTDDRSSLIGAYRW